MNGSISFNAINLQTYDPISKVGIIVDAINHTDAPEKLIDIYAIANANRSAIAGDPEFVSKSIVVTGTIVGTDPADLANRIDMFKGYFNGKEKNLDIGYANGTRRYIATVDKSPIITAKAKKRWAPFTLRFLCADPFGRDITTTPLWAPKTAFTGATFTEQPIIGGTAPYQYPKFTITLNSFTGAGDYIQIANDNNNQEILLYGLSLQAGDVIVIDSEQRRVTVNDEDVDYYGTFLELEPGNGSITYTDGFLTRSVDVEGEYTKRYQ